METKTIHLDKIDEYLTENPNVEDFEWSAGSLRVWLDGGLQAEDIWDLKRWGVEVESIRESGVVAFKRL